MENGEFDDDVDVRIEIEVEDNTEEENSSQGEDYAAEDELEADQGRCRRPFPWMNDYVLVMSSST